jgi:N-acetylneuraminate synthase/N,N'-diacetyllegionaminate synthase
MTHPSLFIIAEAGVNHNGDIHLAKKLVDEARRAGANAVKFQTWKPGELTGRFAVKVPYLETSVPSDESRFELSRRLCLPYEAFRELNAYCKTVGIQFLSTPDGFESLDFLVDELSMSAIKVGSTELNHIAFLEAVGAKCRPVFLSTGLGTLAEVDMAVAALRRGGGNDLPITVMQCTSEYPAPQEEMNLRVMESYAKALQVPVGLSDHSTGYEASIAAVALGATVIEKHFTLSRSMAGPDHAASLEPMELAQFVSGLKKVVVMLGDGVKKPTPAELRNMSGIRRSVVAARGLAEGTVLAAADLGCKRPGTGVLPADIHKLVGMRLNRALAFDEPISWADVQTIPQSG